MAKPLKPHTAVAPQPRMSDDAVGYFYPREVAEILGVPEIDYQQLRRLFRLVRAHSSVPAQERQWGRYTLRDIAAVREALRLCGGKEALAPGRRLQFKALESALDALSAAGITDPLLEASLERLGREVVVLVEGNVIDPSTGQMALKAVFEEAQGWVNAQESGGALLQRMRQERDARAGNARFRKAARAAV